MNQNVRVSKSNTSESKCIYCHESVGSISHPYLTCEKCSACIHEECDSTGRCMIPGCDEPLPNAKVPAEAIDRHGVTISPKDQERRENIERVRRRRFIKSRIVGFLVMLTALVVLPSLSWLFYQNNLGAPRLDKLNTNIAMIVIPMFLIVVGACAGVYEYWRDGS